MIEADTCDSLKSYCDRIKRGEVTKDDLRKEREIILDLYKHHLKLLLEANVFLYAISGALLSFLVTHLGVPHIRWVLIFPALFDLAFAVFFFRTRRGIDLNERELRLISRTLGVNTYPMVEALRLALLISGTALLVAAVLVGLAGVML